MAEIKVQKLSYGGWDNCVQITNDIVDLIVTADDLYLVGGDTIYSLRIPRALGDTIYIQWQRKTTDSVVRYVLA